MAKAKKFWQFKAKQEAEKTGELLLYGEISSTSWWGDEVTPKQFKADLDALGDISTLNIYINSPGGDVFAGQAIYSILKRHPAAKHSYIDGLAASMASVVAVVGTVHMPSNAMMMIHHPWTIAMGNANDFRTMADQLDKIGESFIAVYQEKTGMEAEEINKLLDAETWMTAKDAAALGFADIVEDEQKVAASIADGQLLFGGMAFDLSRFKSLPVDKLEFFRKEEPGNQLKHQETPAAIYETYQKINERRAKYGF